MKGFKDFLMRGNLVEIATGLIIATAFASVVSAFTALLLAIISKIFGGPPTVGDITIADIPVGPFINAVIAFVMMAAIVYFAVIKPYQHMRERFVAQEEETTAEDIELLREIRDELRAGRGKI
ncbi:mechanosensitive ion channel protein MscL [Janibacter melonis]|uniref:Mechanosensitive ion channel protein MscL n=1 Tax=Janibacter melonis TaxID=262209 RepID=A0A176Q9B7_9MICO|nr:MscL family protein [Janibacter melonis]MBD5829465.1 MscL family protein [Janibacter melonis]OAB86274.1 mechanosensitive ion channel protein MscL [Janibacter melonis]